MKNINRKSRRQNLLEWLGVLVIAAAILYFFAPESWWQFGVSPKDQRETASNFSLKAFGGDETLDSESFHGKILVVNYWATWCGPCRFETPSLVNISNEFKDRGVELVGVTVDDNLEDVPPFIEKYKIPYKILLPVNDPNLGTGSLALPTTFLYDKNGKLAKKYTGMVLESTLRSDIKSILGEE